MTKTCKADIPRSDGCGLVAASTRLRYRKLASKVWAEEEEEEEEEVVEAFFFFFFFWLFFVFFFFFWLFFFFSAFFSLSLSFLSSSSSLSSSLSSSSSSGSVYFSCIAHQVCMLRGAFAVGDSSLLHFFADVGAFASWIVALKQGEVEYGMCGGEVGC